MCIKRCSKIAGVGQPGRKRARGFTLLEVIVGVSLLLFAMIGVVPLFIAGLNQSTAVRYKSTATNIAREKMEEIRQLDYREITGVSFLEGRFGVTEDVRGVVYNINYGVAESSYEAGILKEVTVTVDWTAPPKVSPASLTTMIHQQYVGPRISRMEVHAPDPVADSLGTPFDMLNSNQPHTVYCYIAESDWGLVIDNLNQPGMVARDVYLKLARVDDLGNATFFTDFGGDEELTGLVYTLDGDTGLVKEVYIPYTFNSADIPDGYWEFRGVLFNQYDEPGNLWRLRLRVENGYPGTPLAFVAVPQYGDESIRLYWSGSGDEDIDRYCLQRRSKVGADWKSWEDLDMDLALDATNYLDQGNIATMTDPWGTVAAPQYYQYRIWAMDIEGNSGYDVGNIATLSITIPPSEPVTTTTIAPELTTTTLFGTTTTLGDLYYSITIVNTVSKSSYTIQIEPGDISQDDIYATVDKRSTITLDNLPAGYYDITALPSKSGEPVVHGSFTLDASYDPSIPVLKISR